MVTTIFDPTTDLTVDVSDERRDLMHQAQTRLMHQFQNSVLLLCLNGFVAQMEQELYDTAVDVIEGYQLGQAIGAQLDVIGRVVGQPRISLNADRKVWFGYDATANQFASRDAGPRFEPGAQTFGNLPADDGTYRRLIIAKIFKNHVRFSSVPEIIRFGRLLTGRNISVRQIGSRDPVKVFERDEVFRGHDQALRRQNPDPLESEFRAGAMDIGLIVPANMDLGTIRTLITVVDDTRAERRYLTPIPATCRIVDVTFRPSRPFARDRAAHGHDQGARGMTLTVEQVGNLI